VAAQRFANRVEAGKRLARDRPAQDSQLFSPEQVMALHPRPSVVAYR
jgi:hypothetical protein